MNRKFFLLTLTLGAVFLSGCALFNVTPPGSTPTDTKTTQMTEDLQKTVLEVKDPTDTMEQKETPDSTAMMEKSAPVYEEYSQARYSALKGKESFVLFFHAPWCPICRRMEKDITAQLSSFPAGTVILKTDYDTSTELKKEYDVLIQSTVVVVDKNGNVVNKSTDPALEDLKASISKSLGS